MSKKIEAYELLGKCYSENAKVKDHEKALKCFKKLLEYSWT